MRLYELEQKLPNIPELFEISKEIYYWMHQHIPKDDHIKNPGTDHPDTEIVGAKLDHLDKQAEKLGYSVDMEPAEYPFTDVHWLHNDTNTPITFTKEQLENIPNRSKFNE